MHRITTLLILLLLPLRLIGQSADVENYGEISVIPGQDYFELYHMLNSENAQDAYENFVGEFIDVDASSDTSLLRSGSSGDQLYSSRLKMMATEVQLPYNPIVKNYIDRYVRRGGTMEYVLGIGRYYFPIFEQILYEQGLPLELKMLPVIESALIPTARSHAAAVGLWQIILPTAKYYGLEINSFVDERQDPVKSTIAACKFLKDLYKIYGDWTLVIAAYNCGPGNVNKAMRAAGDVGTYWDIWEHLPRETRNYVPAYIAASYSYTFYKAHSLKPKEISIPLSVDTLTINRMVHFDQISTTIAISNDELRQLNPQYRIDIIPALQKPYTLVLPTNLIGDFIDHESDIYVKDSVYLKKYLQVSNLSQEKALEIASSTHSYPKGKKMTYKIRSGDTLGGIALKFNVKVSEIQKWNSLRGTNIRAGKTLIIYPR